MRAGREDDGVAAAQALGELRHGVGDEVALHRFGAGGPHRLGLRRVAVQTADAVPALGQSAGEAASDAAGGTDHEDVHASTVPAGPAGKHPEVGR